MISQIDFFEAKLSCEIDSWDLAESLKGQDQVIVIDVRSEEVYAKEHIPSAVNLPHREITADSTSFLDTSRTYVTYCDGIVCNASSKGALQLARLGFTVRELLGGLDWWKRDGYETEGRDAAVGTSVSCSCN
jgi:rhodanese-related sulfurtransferase